MKLEEITVERIKESYAKTGLKPGKFKTPGCACALQTLAKELLGTTRTWYGVIDEKEDSLSRAFSHGFDFPAIKLKSNYAEKEQKAFLKGQEIAKALGL